MKPWIVVAAICLAAGCSNDAGQDAHEHAGPKASSISTEDGHASSMSMQQHQTTGTGQGGGGWFGWLDLDNLLGRNAPGGTVTTRPPQGQAVVPQQPAAPQRPAAQPAAPQPAAPQSAGDASRFPQEVLNLVNQERAKSGLNPLRMNSALSNMAMDKAKDMVDNRYFDHQSPTYGSPFDMMNAYGISYNTAAENIAQGQRSPAEVMNSWMNSQGHRANILNGSFTEIGVAYYNGSWVQVFIG
ncbi:MAG TPA: CAP domain-containing protein [Paenibacillus sp.]|nr:CAP domain-containing protein [Paenibacillus sp.]